MSNRSINWTALFTESTSGPALIKALLDINNHSSGTKLTLTQSKYIPHRKEEQNALCERVAHQCMKLYKLYRRGINYHYIWVNDKTFLWINELTHLWMIIVTQKALNLPLLNLLSYHWKVDIMTLLGGEVLNFGDWTQKSSLVPSS